MLMKLNALPTSFNIVTLSSKLSKVQKPSVRVQILKSYKSKDINFTPGEIVWVNEKLADELILADAGEYPEEQIDIEIERITRENPEAIANLNAYLDSEIAAGRCEPMETLCAEERKRRRKK
jgi:hypothetical protein